MTNHVMQSFSEHIQRVRAAVDPLLERYHYDALMVHSGAPMFRFMDDLEYPFKVNPHFNWWVPSAVPDSVVLYRPGEKPRLFYFQPVDYWHLPPAPPDESWANEFDITLIRKGDEWREHVVDAASLAVLGNAPRLAVHFTQAAINPTALIHEINLCRIPKTEYEKRCLIEANLRAARGHNAAASAYAAGASEFETHLAYLQATSHSEQQLPYGNIIAQNEHGGVLHYHGLDRTPPAQRHSFLIDAGAQFQGYAADITRTYTPDTEGVFCDLLAAMEAAQLDLVDGVRNGASYVDLHLKAHRVISRILRDADIVRMNPDDMVEQRVSSAFYPHGLGHYLGLQVHDVGGHLSDEVGSKIERPEGHPYLRLTRPLATDSVVTIEPGVYFIPQLLEPLKARPEVNSAINWSLVESLQPYGGIRIEDDVLVLAEGAPRNFSREAFSQLAQAKAA